MDFRLNAGRNAFVNWKRLFLLLLTLLVLQLPVIGPFLQAANTMIHETGHAAAGLLSRGEVYEIHLFANTEGITRVGFSSWWGAVLTGVSGYLFASWTAFLLAALWSRNKTRTVLFLMLAFSLCNLVLWIRNAYGIIWVACFILFLLFVLRLRRPGWRHSAAFILITIMVMDSVRSAFAVLLLSLMHPEQSGDAALLARFTTVPPAAWGTFFFLHSILFGWKAVRNLMSVRRDPHPLTGTVRETSQ